ncbi:MAG: hypothetical protein P1V51_05075 [Deltaproteobacteria bacterium]|nr:hypothetical protein [Deltaproteobacteria bacterium]
MTEPSAGRRVSCSSCGAPATWSPGDGALACEHCGATTMVDAPEGELPEHAIEEALHKARRGFDREVQRLRCAECGAVSDTDPGMLSSICSFCGAHGVVELKETTDHVVPGAVLPFTFSREATLAAYREWLEGLWFRPDDLRRRARLEELHGIYLPFWAYDADVHSWWKAIEPFDTEKAVPYDPAYRRFRNPCG